MADKYAVSMTLTIEASSLTEGRDNAERLLEILTNEFGSLAYYVEIQESETGDALPEALLGCEPVTYH
jgi:hypothetical protein